MRHSKIAEFWKQNLEKQAKQIAICNVGHVGLQQKYILLVLHILKNELDFKNKKIAVISFNFHQGVFKDLVKEIKPQFLQIPNQTGADFLNWNYLLNHNIPEDYFDGYDLVIWDLPDLNFIGHNSSAMEKYFSLFDAMDIVALPSNGGDEINHIKRINNYFNTHGFKLPNLAENISKVDSKRNFMSLIKKVAGF